MVNTSAAAAAVTLSDVGAPQLLRGASHLLDHLSSADKAAAQMGRSDVVGNNGPKKQISI